jgi:hypothetical protein
MWTQTLNAKTPVYIDETRFVISGPCAIVASPVGLAVLPPLAAVELAAEAAGVALPELGLVAVLAPALLLVAVFPPLLPLSPPDVVGVLSLLPQAARKAASVPAPAPAAMSCKTCRRVTSRNAQPDGCSACGSSSKDISPPFRQVHLPACRQIDP